jgi:hypothetical protein
MPGEERARWKVHPARDRPKGLAAVCLTSILIGISSYFAFGGLVYSIIWILLFLSSLSDFILPTSYRISGDGIYVRRPISDGFMPWDKVRRCVVSKDGLRLFPGDGMKGMFLPFGGMDPEFLTGLVREMVGEGVKWEDLRGRRSL